jgi:hypothetical protein
MANYIWYITRFPARSRSSRASRREAVASRSRSLFPDQAMLDKTHQYYVYTARPT